MFSLEKQTIMKWPGSLLAFMVTEGRFKGTEEYVFSLLYIYCFVSNLSPQSPIALPSLLSPLFSFRYPLSLHFLILLRVRMDRNPIFFPSIISTMRGSARAVPQREFYQDEVHFWFHSNSSLWELQHYLLQL